MKTIFLLKNMQHYDEPDFLGVATTLTELLTHISANSAAFRLVDNPLNDRVGVVIDEVPVGLFGDDFSEHAKHYNWRGERIEVTEERNYSSCIFGCL